MQLEHRWMQAHFAIHRLLEHLVVLVGFGKAVELVRVDKVNADREQATRMQEVLPCLGRWALH